MTNRAMERLDDCLDTLILALAVVYLLFVTSGWVAVACMLLGGFVFKVIVTQSVIWAAHRSVKKNDAP